MMNISQIFEEHGTNIILLDSDLGTTFGIVKIDKETFELPDIIKEISFGFNIPYLFDTCSKTL